MAVLWSIKLWLIVFQLAPAKAEKEYEEGIIIKVLGIEVYNNVE